MSESILIIIDDTSILPGVPASNITVTYENTVIEITQQEYEIIEIAEAARGIPGIQGLPGAVEEHTHIIGDVTGLQTALDSKQAAGSYASLSHTHDDRYYTETEIDAFLGDITPADHTHVIDDVTGLQAALDSKQAAGSYAAASHTHIIGDVTGLQASLDGKQAAGSYATASHTHDDRYYTETESDALLDAKQDAGSYAATVHTHVISDTTGLQAALDSKQAAGSYAAASHTHDDRYYTETEIDTALALKQDVLSEASSTQDGYLTSEDYLRFEDSANSFIGNALVSGSAVWSGSGLVYNVTDTIYYIDGVRYTSAAANITLSAADATHPRIDIIYVDASGTANKITGTPGANPIKPIADPSTQLELTSILVPAGATTPSGVSNETVYAENAEWTTSSNGTGSPNFNATTDPFAGTKHISVSAFISTAGSASQLTFTDSGTNSVGSFTSLSFRIKLGASFPNSGRINVLLKNGSSIISSNVIVQSGQYGFSRNDTTNYQLISIPISAFTLNVGVGASFDVLVLSFYGTGGSASIPAFKVDGIVFQAGATGGTPTGVTTFNSRNGNVLPTPGDYTATQITNTPAGTIAATTVQGAIDELAADMDAVIQYNFFEDFVNPTIVTNLASGPTGAGAGVSATTSEGHRPGIARHSTGTTTTGRSCLSFHSSAFQFGSTTWTCEGPHRVNILSVLAERFTYLFGFGDLNTGINQADGCYFLYDEGGVTTGSPGGSANWQCVTVSNSSRTFTTTSVPVAAATWYKLTIEVNAAGTSVVFKINGTTVATHSTTVPTGGGRETGFINTLLKSLGTTARTVDVDYIKIKSGIITR
jgi:hypothetical protein